MAAGVAGGIYAAKTPGWQRIRQGELAEEHEERADSDSHGDFASCMEKRGLGWMDDTGLWVGVDDVYQVPGEYSGDPMDLDWDFDHHDDDDPEDCIGTITVSRDTTTSVTSTRTCWGDVWPQACANYRSVASHMWMNNQNPANSPNELLCPYQNPGTNRWIPGRWNAEHTGWRRWLPRINAAAGVTRNCERDEFPFLRFTGMPGVDRTAQWVRV